MSLKRVCDVCGKEIKVADDAYGQLGFFYPENYMDDKKYDICDNCMTYIRQGFDSMKKVIETGTTFTFTLKKEDLVNENNP